MMQPVSFDEVVDSIVAKDPRFHRDAYFFLREALDHTQKSVAKTRKGSKPQELSHVTPAQLLDGVREYALRQYGPMTLTLLSEWGVYRCQDFGEIVFNMVEAGLLGKTDKDSRDDFRSGFDFEEAFRRPFLPSASAGESIPASPAKP